jgi:septum formation protein
VDSIRRPLILASTSPRRHELLRSAGFDFVVAPPGVEETVLPGESPEVMARRLALLKARAVAERSTPESCVLAADTLVVLDERVLGKPQDVDEAARMLLTLAGRAHRVVTGFALLVAGTDLCEVAVEQSEVRMRPVGSDEARAYAADGEPLDKAGAYAVQGAGGRFVEAIDGSRSNVIGLPLEAVLPRLAAFGVRPSCSH